MLKKPKSPGSHREDNPLKTARAPEEVRRKPARVSKLSEEDASQPVKLKDKMLPGMSKKSRASHSRTAEILRAPPLKTKIA
jgi:hypothetical protein